MPYIEQKDRHKLQPAIDVFRQYVDGCGVELTAGVLNYVISTIVWDEFDKNPGYTRANELMGMLQGVQSEFYRRKVAPYEDEKIEENGDI